MTDALRGRLYELLGFSDNFWEVLQIPCRNRAVAESTARIRHRVVSNACANPWLRRECIDAKLRLSGFRPADVD